MRLRQHNAPKSFNWDLAQITDPSLSFLISVMGTVTRASGAMVYIGVDLRTPDKLPRELGQAGRGARFCPARKEGRRAPVPVLSLGPCRCSLLAMEAIAAHCDLASACLLVDPLSCPYLPISGLQGTWLPPRFCTYWFVGQHCPLKGQNVCM